MRVVSRGSTPGSYWYVFFLTMTVSFIRSRLMHNTGLGVQCVIAKSFSFIYGRNQPTLGLLGITMQDGSFYENATDGSEITIDVYGRGISIGERRWKFELDNLEIKMLQNKGLAEAYKKFGKNVFDCLCEGKEDASGSLGMETTHMDSSLEW